MTHKKDLNSKSRTKEKHKFKPVIDHSDQDGQTSKPLPNSFSLKKFIALPKGLRVKSTSDTPENNSPRRPTPVKAVPGLALPNTDYSQDIGVSTVYIPDHAEHGITTDNRLGHSRRSSSIYSSTGSTPNGSISSIPSEGSYTPRYRKRSRSTPPDLGRQRLSPVDRQIGKVVKQYYTDLYNSVNNNGGFSNLNYNGSGNLNYSYNSDVESDIGSFSLDCYSDDDNFSLDSRTSDVTEVLNNWELNSPPSTNKSHTNSASNFQDDSSIPPGHNSIMHPHYLTLPRGGGQQLARATINTQDFQNGPVRPSMAYVNGTLPRGGGGTLVYRPYHSNDVILMGQYDNMAGSVPGNHPFIDGRQVQSAGNLRQSKALSSSMPTLLDGKGKADKKFLKELKKREKEEKKRREKEEKRRLKEEKKIQKALKKQQIRTLPRNWGYINKPIETVYGRQRLSLAAVPIDYDETASVKTHVPAVPAPANPPPPAPMQPSIKTRSLYSSAPDLLRLEQVYGATIRGVPSSNHGKYSVTSNGGIHTNAVQGVHPNGLKIQTSNYAPRTVVLQRGPEGYGFVLRGAKSTSNTTGELDFCPTAEFPALQYLDSVDPGSRSDRAGLRSGDFLLEINGENVIRASHDRVVQLIRQAGDSLKMKVVTVKPSDMQDNWVQQHQDGSMTLPSRGASKRQAPLPPKRDPQTSISLTKSQGKQIAESMAELDQLDKALDEYDTQGEVTQEQKTASIRSRHSAKRVSLVDLSNLESNQGEEKHMSPSEMRIKKYHQTKKQNGSVSGMERSRSTSDLLDGKRPEPVYATPVQVPNKPVKHQRSASGSGDITDKYDYRMEEDNVSLKSSASYGGSTGKLSIPAGERPKAPPPPPPGGTLPKRQAPPPPKGVEPISAAKTELVSISTNRKSIYANPAEVIPPSLPAATENSDFESSFRPGTSAKLSDEPKIKTKALEEVKMKSHQRNASATSGRSAASEGSDNSDKHSVSFAEDKVYDSAKSFLKKHPNAQLLVTADVHLKKPAEPAPDYDLSDDETKKPAVTVISIGDKKQVTSTTKHYTIKHSDIPESSVSNDDRKEVVIPPPPQEPAPQPPTMKTTRPASPVLRSSSVNIEERQIKSEPKVEVKVEVAPPAATPPPPPPPPPPVTPATSIPSTPVTPKKTPEVPSNVTAIPTGDILAAVQKRQSRLQSEGVKLTPLPEKKIPQNDTQAALLAAVAKRRTALLQKSENEVVDSIEQRLNKSKKLHAAKFSSDNMKKTDNKPTEQKTTVAPKVSPKAEPKAKEQYVFKLSSDTPAAKPVFSSENSKTTSQSKVTTTNVTKTTEVSNGTDSVQQQSAKDKVKDFLAEAERARQEWLQKKAGPSFRKSEDSKPVVTKTTTKSTSSLVTTTTNENRKISAPAVKTSPAPVPVSNRNITPEKKPVPVDIVISTKSDNKPKANGIVRKDSIVTTQPVQKRSDKLGIMPVKGRDTELATNKTSIRDRIASFEKNKTNEPGALNNRKRSTSPSSTRYTVHGVTTDSSVTDKKTSALPPPPGFGDAVQIDIIPPPTSFRPQQDNDAASVVSSLSTLSTLSDEHADSGYSPSKHSYDEVIPPPPPGFDDTNDLGYDEIPSVIPPPPDFDSNENNNNIKHTSRVDKPFVSKSVDMWQCLDVLDWLDSLNLSQYKPSFQSHCIDGKKLVGLSRSDYIDLGVAQVGHRMNLERSIKKVALRKSVTS